MTPIGPLAPPPCHLCGGAGEITDPHDDPTACQHCGGSGAEPPVPAAVLEAEGQGTLFTLAPLILVIVVLLVGIGLVDVALFVAIAVCELIDRYRQQQERAARVTPIESRRRPYPATSREWERWA